jgi:hypothetical protein
LYITRKVDVASTPGKGRVHMRGMALVYQLQIDHEKNPMLSGIGILSFLPSSIILSLLSVVEPERADHKSGEKNESYT